MKRNSQETRKWNEIHARNSNRRRIKQNQRARARRRATTAGQPLFHENNPNLRQSNRNFWLDLPEDLSFSRNFDATASALATLRDFSTTHRLRYRLKSLNFNAVRDIAPTACLVLAGELDRWDLSVRRRLKSNASEWDPTVAQLFYEMGLFDLLGKAPPAHCTDPHLAQRILDQTFIRFTSGTTADGSLAMSLRRNLEAIAGPVHRQPLFEGLTEAMTNVVHHAYPTENDRRDLRGEKRWWMSGGYDRRNQDLTISIFDQGITIPGSLPLSTHWERVLAYLSRLGLSRQSDANMIKGAMEAGRTSTGASHHGKGLPQMRNFVDKSGTGHVRILSRHGEYLYTLRDGRSKITLDTHSTAIRGTIIEWRVPVARTS